MSDSSRARIGIRDVATAAGVSTATVSNALNGTGRIDPATRARVVEVATSLGYRANANAQRLRGGRTGMLAVTAREPNADGYGLMDVEYFVDVLMAAASVALHRGYSLTLVPASASNSALTEAAVDGVLLFDALRSDPLLADLADAGTPVVTVGRDTSLPADACWWVDNDMTTGVTALLDHLHAAGSRRVALVSGSPEYSYCADAEDAYQEWARVQGVEPVVAHVSDEPGHGTIHALLDRPDPPDAVCAVLERYALATLTVATELGLSVPDDLRIAAASDSAAARHRGVTALDLHPDQVGHDAVELLLDRVTGTAQSPVHHLVSADIAVRLTS